MTAAESERIATVIRESKTRADAARKLGVSTATVRAWAALLRALEHDVPLRKAGRKPVDFAPPVVSKDAPP